MEIRVANKRDVWHLVQRGMLTQFHFDFEGFGLNTQFAQIASYGRARGDIAGNYADSTELHVKRPDRYVSTPQALMVTRTPATELDEEDRLPHRVAMAKIAQDFENSPLAAAAFGSSRIESFSTVRKKGEDLYSTEQDPEEVVYYPLLDDTKKMEIGADGNIVTDPAGMLELNDKGEVLFEGKVVKVPKKVGTYTDELTGQEKPIYDYKAMTPADGAITFDVRIHPKRKMIAYKFDEDPHSPYYENIENNYCEGDDKAKWKLTDARLLVNGYRIKWYDIPLLRSNLVRGGFHPSNIFFTHSKATVSNKQLPKNFAVDGYSAVMRTHLVGPQGEEGLKISGRTDSRTGEDVSSAKLELVMAENTRFENRDRNVRGGVVMPDGSAYDGRKGHKSPAYDSEASFAAYNYCRELAPDVIKNQELQADEDYLREFLPGLDLFDPYPPIFAMLRGNYPDAPVLDPMAFVGFDDQQGQLRRAISVRLDLADLKNYSYKGKTLEQMAKEDMKQPDPAKRNFVRMIKDQGRDNDSLIRVESLRKFHGADKLEDVMHTPSAQTWDIEQLDDNFRYLVDENNGFILEAIRDAVEVMNWEMRSKPLPANPRLEEQWPYNSFGDIDFLEYEAKEEIVRRKNMPRKGQTEGVVQMLYEKAMDVFKYHNAIDELLHRVAIQPQPIDLYGYDETLDLRKAVGDYWDLFKKVKGRLDEKGCPYVSVFDDYLDDNGNLVPPGVVINEKINEKTGHVRTWRTKLEDMDEAELEAAHNAIQSFRWGLMERMLQDDELERNDKRSEYDKGLFDHKYSKKGRILCGNLSRDFRIVDQRGRELSIQYIKRNFAHQPHIVQKRLENKDWRIQFFRQTSEPTTSVILMQYADMGRLDELDPIWQFRYKALRALYLNGPPNEDPSNMRMDAIPVLERALKALEVNHPIDEDEGLARVFSRYVSGEAEVFLRSEEGQRFLAEYKEYLDNIKEEFPFLDEYKMAMGYEPSSGLPYDWLEHEVDPDNVVIIDVPDAHLRNPLEDTRQSPCSLVIPKVSKTDRKKIGAGVDVILRGMQTGKLYHPGKASVLKAPAEGPRYEDYYEQARRAYKDEAGIKFPPPSKRNILIIQEELMPVANTRVVDLLVQSLKVPTQHFDGLTCPRMAHFEDDEPLTGLALPADYCPQELKVGRTIRFREMEAAMGSKIHGKEGLETGFTLETTLREARKVTVGGLLEEISEGKFTDDNARRYGYAGAYDMWEKINQRFVENESADAAGEEILLLEFDEVDMNSSAYINMFKPAKAAFVSNKTPPSPSPFRNGKPSNDNAEDGALNSPVTEVSVPDNRPDSAPGVS